MIPGINNDLLKDVCELREFIQELLNYNESIGQLIDDDSYYIKTYNELFTRTYYCEKNKV